MESYDKKRLNEMHVLYGKTCRESTTSLGHAPILFNPKSNKRARDALAINLKSYKYEIQIGSWIYDELYHHDTYIVIPKELA